MYVLAPNQQVEKFPYSIGELRRDNSSVSFPSNPDDNLLAEWGVFKVEQAPPVFDSTTQDAIAQDPVFKDGKWVESWLIVDASPEEVQRRLEAKADYSGFYDALVKSNVYASIRAQALSSIELALACTEFIATITTAKLSRISFGEDGKLQMQNCIENILASASLSPSETTQLVTLMADYGLSGIYTLPS